MTFSEFDITVPDDPADVVVNVRISGNALVSALNTLQRHLCERPNPRTEWIVERLRDQLAEARSAK